MKLRKILFCLVLALCLSTSVALAAEKPFYVGNTGYDTLADAYNAASVGGTIRMTQNVTGAGQVIDKDITIDFGGHTYTFTTPAVGSTGTETNGFQILQGNNVTLKNGTLEISSSARKACYIMVQNYSNLTLKDMTLDGHYLDRQEEKGADGYCYTLSNNCGNIALLGKTSIIANPNIANSFAFDVYDWTDANYSVPTVTVDTTGEITGEIKVSTSIENNLTIKNGTFSIDPGLYVSGTTPVARVENASGIEKYCVGANTITNAITDGCTVTVLQGNWTANVNTNVTVENWSEGGTVVVNNTAIAYENFVTFTPAVAVKESTSTRVPKTGDESQIALWACLMTLSAAAFVALAKKARAN